MMAIGSEARTIVVGEDEPEVRGYLDMALRSFGFNTELAQDGNEVLRFLESDGQSVVAVLLDVMMPLMDGLTTLANLRKSPRTADIPVLFLTARAQPGE